MARILFAPDSFKGSLESSKVASALSRGWRSVRPEDSLIRLPQADGGEGTLDVIFALQPKAKKIYSKVHDANGVLKDAYWLLLEDGSAVVELAQACGLTPESQQDPMGAHTFGLGELLAQATAHPDVEKIYVALGGSASTDGGVGALMGLGFRFLDHHGDLVPLGGRGLSSIASIKADDVPSGPRVVVLVDVMSALLGEHGAASVYGPQKGASASQVAELNQGLENFLRVVGIGDFDGAGSAGGTAYGLVALLEAQIESGADYVSKLSHLQRQISKSDLVITGEGQFDQTSFNGKVVGKVLSQALEMGTKVAICAGAINSATPEGVWSWISLTDLAANQQEAIAHSEQYLFKAGAELAQRFNQ